MSNSIRDILDRLTQIQESAITPVKVTNGLNRQQRSVPQLPALLKAKKISVLGSSRDPQHPFQGYAVGADESKAPAKNALEEAMQEVEEDMLSRVKQDLNRYLDRLDKKHADDGKRDADTPTLDKLAKKERIDRDLIQKAVDAIERRQAEEDIAEDGQSDYELSDPSTVHDIEDKVDADLGQPQQPVKVMELDDGTVFEIHGDDGLGYHIRHGNRSLPSRFKTADEAGIAVDLFRAHRRQQQKQDLSQDYIEEH